jgi:hypothetical protein
VRFALVGTVQLTLLVELLVPAAKLLGKPDEPKGSQMVTVKLVLPAV